MISQKNREYHSDGLFDAENIFCFFVKRACQTLRFLLEYYSLPMLM